MPKRDRRNAATFWVDDSLTGVSYLAADFTSHVYAPHMHDAWVVAVTEEGGSIFKSRGETQEAGPTDVLVFNPVEPHSGYLGRSRRWRYRGFYITEGGIRSIQSRLGLAEPPYFLRNRLNRPRLAERLKALHRCIADNEDALLQEELFAACFGMLAREADRPDGAVDTPTFDMSRRGHAMVRRLVRHLHDVHTEDIRLQDIASAEDITVFQLIRLFKGGLGITPHAYLLNLRLRTAMRAMKENTPIAEAAILAGFYDQSALNKHFKRSFGITPLQWLHAMRS